MQQEGLAREIVNRVQKLRKKAMLTPSDDIIVYCDVSPLSHEVALVRQEYIEFIQNSIRSAFKYGTEKPRYQREIIKEVAEVIV